jgi:6-phospho-3-hexuloisomerase
MKLSEITTPGVIELQQVMAGIRDDQAEALVTEILGANRIFLTGAGRSLLAVRGCAMRLMQMGLTSYVVGETTTPSIREGDLLLAVSGSGETSGICAAARKAKNLGAKLALVTIVPTSTLGQLADAVLVIPAKSTKVTAIDAKDTVHLGGSLFEQCAFITLDCMINLVAEGMGLDNPNKTLMENHANLE